MSELLDRDAVWTPDDALDEVVLEMSRDLDLPRDWMNDRVRPMLPRVIDSGQAEAVWGEGMLRDETVFALREGLRERGISS